MKTLTLAVLLSCAPVFAQTAPPPTPPPTTQLGTLQDTQDKLGTQLQLLYERLHGITEFQQYLQVRTAYEENQRQIDALKAEAAKPKPEAKPTKSAPVVPPTK